MLILDEPTSGLDPLMQKQFIQLLREEKARGKTILLSSHLFEEVESTCDRVAMIKDGRLITTGAIEELEASRKKRYTLLFPGSPHGGGVRLRLGANRQQRHLPGRGAWPGNRLSGRDGRSADQGGLPVPGLRHRIGSPYVGRMVFTVLREG